MGGRGLMTTTEQRLVLLPLIEKALIGGARLQKACYQIGLSQRTVQRWRHPGAFEGDRRVKSLRKSLHFEFKGIFSPSLFLTHFNTSITIFSSKVKNYVFRGQGHTAPSLL